MKVKPILFYIILCVSSFVYAQQETKDFLKAKELYINGSYQDAYELFLTEIINNPDNACYCYVYIANIFQYNERYEEALSFLDKAIKTNKKKDKVWLAVTYGSKGDIYTAMEDIDNALKNYTKALKINNTYNYAYLRRGEIYMDRGDCKKAEKDFKSVVSSSPMYFLGYYELGNLYFYMQEYEKAEENLTHAILLENETSEIYYLRAKTYLRLGRYDAMADDIIDAFVIDDSSDEWNNLRQELDEQAVQTLKSKLMLKINTYPDNPDYLYWLGGIYLYRGDYKKAVEYYKKAHQIIPSYKWTTNIAALYSYKGFYDTAVKYLDELLEVDSSATALYFKADCLYGMEKFEESIKTYDDCIKKSPTDYSFYYLRGLTKEKIDDLEGAIDDYSITILLTPHSDVYLQRGKCYLKNNQKKLAEKDFNKIIESSENSADDNIVMFAYYYLSEIDTAKAMADRIYENKEETQSSQFYLLARLYSLLGEKQKVLFALAYALEGGYDNFMDVDMNDDFDNIRDEQEFKDVVQKYKKQFNWQNPAF